MTRTLTLWEELCLWWEFEGELRFEVLTYFGVCSTAGYLQGWYIGCQIVRLLP